MQERLQKILSGAGVTSRRAAEVMITEGRVSVNGVTVTELGSKADPEKDKIAVDGKPVSMQKNKIYLLLNKPAGYVTTMSDPDGRPVITELIKGIPERLYPVGRLDFNTEGLLLLTNDGDWANKLAHPSHEVEKEYLVKIRGVLGSDKIALLSGGIQLEDGMTAPAKIELIRALEKNVWFTMTIHEGRYRQVRRMCEAAELPLVKLKRIRYGNILLGDLKTGEYRLLDPAEARMLAGVEKKPRGEQMTKAAPVRKRPKSR
ncbi:MAG: rRNA pseudouridine synthase [Geobacteraceae bacterium]|nr:rRNA pseudouridine synthase [Geobacteraceae bacterium]